MKETFTDLTTKKDLEDALMKVEDKILTLIRERTDIVIDSEHKMYKQEQESGYRNPIWIKIIKKEREEIKKLEEIKHISRRARLEKYANTLEYK